MITIDFTSKLRPDPIDQTSYFNRPAAAVGPKADLPNPPTDFLPIPKLDGQWTPRAGPSREHFQLALVARRRLPMSISPRQSQWIP